MPVLVSILLYDEPGLVPLRFFGYPLTALALIFALLYVRNNYKIWQARRRRGNAVPRTSRAGLLERLLWIVGYAWVVTAALSLLTRQWLAPTIAVTIWLAISLWAVLRPGVA